MLNVLWLSLSCGRSYNVLVYDRVAFNSTLNAFIHNYWKKKLLLYSGSKFLIVGWKLIFSWKWNSPEYLFWCFITYRYWTKVLSVLSILFWNRHKWWKKLSFINDDSCCIITRQFSQKSYKQTPSDMTQSRFNLYKTTLPYQYTFRNHRLPYLLRHCCA